MEFSNPLPPQSFSQQTSQDDSHPLTNDDFRKLMMTPRAGGPTTTATAPSFSAKVNSSASKPNATEERKKRKLYYAKLKKMEDEKQKELNDKYRDRAKERRDGKGAGDDPPSLSTTADYRSVAPDIKVGATQAEKRRQIIEESKYLGGDMEHTHLVKGLDYALLEKVRAEITIKETDDDELEMALEAGAVENEEKQKEEEEENTEFRCKMAKNVYRHLFKNKLPERNELFTPGRMAYVVDLEEDYPENDIPTTAIRSKADCPHAPEMNATLSTNDIVINKLTQILSYLRQGRRDKKKRKEKEKAGKLDEGKSKNEAKDNVDIFGDSMDPRKHSDRDRDRGHDRDRERGRDKKSDRHRKDDRERDRYHERRHDDNRDKKRSYFEKPEEREDRESRMKDSKSRQESTSNFIKGLSKQYSEKWNEMDAKKDKPTAKSEKSVKMKRKAEIDHYAECYPGMDEAADAIVDSDDEADFTKMDMGNKKGPVNRWDFENDEQYQEYMSKKEALPKAAFQYGVKMNDGRKTRRAAPKDDKAALDREWQKIQNMLQQRKEGGGGSKKAKY